MTDSAPKLLILCTVSPGLDAVDMVMQSAENVVGLAGVHPDAINPNSVSGYVNISTVAEGFGVQGILLRSYDLSHPEDRRTLEALDFDLIWVAGWQRLVPKWLIDCAPLAVLGTHGSPDGITGGRGRSPQNWALLLGCRSFDLALFIIGTGVDDGPVVSNRRFFYEDTDDIEVSYYRASTATAEMVLEVLEDPQSLELSQHQHGESRYLPQRRPEDGMIDWALPMAQILRQIRALTRPYPGMATKQNGCTVRLWRGQVFDDNVCLPFGTIGQCFISGDFLISCADGRVLVRDWNSDDPNWKPVRGTVLESQNWAQTMETLINRHRENSPEQPLSRRLGLWV